MLKILVVLFFLSEIVSAADNVQITLAAFASSKQVYRGALIWDTPSLMAGPSFTFFNKVRLGGGRGGLSIFNTFAEYHTFSLSASYFDDNEPLLPFEDKPLDFKNQRRATFGSTLTYRFSYQRAFNVVLAHSKDLKRHHGHYTNINISGSLIPLVTFGSALGIGDRDNNAYVYGPESAGGIGHHDVFVSVMLPFLPGGGRMIINNNYSKITKSANYNADYIRGNKSNFVMSMVCLWSL